MSEIEKGLPFYWKSKRQLIPGYGVRGNMYSLFCRACGQRVLRAAPMNAPGRRYFLHMAMLEAERHLAECGSVAKAA